MENLAFPPDSERSMVEFMNEHYAHSNLMYAKVYGQLSQAMEARMARMQELVRRVREIRNTYSVDVKTPVDLCVRCAASIAGDFRALAPFIGALAGVGKLECGPAVAKPTGGE